MKGRAKREDGNENNELLISYPTQPMRMNQDKAKTQHDLLVFL